LTAGLVEETGGGLVVIAESVDDEAGARSEQRLAVGGRSTRASAGRREGRWPECGLDGGGRHLVFRS
jgi:hypothetical protein